MTDPDNDSADDERSLFAKILRRSADELEQPDEGEPDGDPDVESRADEEDDDEDENGDVDPVDRALSEGTIEAAQASKLRDVTERMDGPGVQTLVDAISENDLDVDEAVEMIEAVNGDEGMDVPEDDNEPEELKARGEEPDISDEEIEELQSRLDTVPGLVEKVESIEQRLEDETDASEEVEEVVEQRLDFGDHDDFEGFMEDLVQRSLEDGEIVTTPQNVTVGGDREGPTVRESLGLEGGD